MKKSWNRIPLLSLLLLMALLLNGCSSNSKEGPITLTNQDAATVTQYIRDFLTNGYSEFYIVEEVQSAIISAKKIGNRVEVLLQTTMKATNYPVADPNQIPYIQEAREAYEKEKDPDRRRVLEEQHQSLLREYNAPFTSSFSFKVEGEMETQIKRETLRLYLEQENPSAEQGGVIYVPAAKVLFDLQSDATLLIGDEAHLRLQNLYQEGELDAIFGKALDVQREVLGPGADTFIGSTIELRKYPGLTLQLFSPKDDGKNMYLHQITVEGKTEGREFRTIRDITIGSLQEQVLTRYPEATWSFAQDPQNGTLRYEIRDYQYLEFFIQDGKVSKIQLIFEIP